MIGHVLAGNTVREKQRSEADRLLKNCLQSRTFSSAQPHKLPRRVQGQLGTVGPR